METWPALVLLVLVHLGGSHLSMLDRIPRSRWLSFAGGASVAFVFLHLLPQLAATEEHLEPVPLRNPTYLAALVSFAAFYGLERLLLLHHGRSTPGEVFWLHVGTFTVYNALVGYLLAAGEEPVVLFTVAMGLHFLVTDNSLRRSAPRRYRRRGRWVASAGIVAGWTTGVLTDLHGVVVAVLVAALAGGIILNVLKEELPQEKESRLGAFLAGVAVLALPLVV